MSREYRFFYHGGLYDLEKTADLFVRAIAKNVAHHKKNCPEYAAILSHKGFDEALLRREDDLYRLPPIPTLYFKRHSLYSAPPHRLFFKSTTSGTSGTVGGVGFDLKSGTRALGMVLNTFFSHRLVTPRPANYIVLGYEPSRRNKVGAVKTAYAATFAAPAIHREYALKDNGNGYDLNLEGLKNTLIKYEKSGRPVRFMGFPAYFMFLLRELEASGIRLKLHPKSLIMLAGGWKQFFEQKVDKETLYAASHELLGIGSGRVREFFGAVEHPIAYCDCKNHHFHVPVYSRVIIRDGDLNPVGYHKPGILNLITPMMTSMPFISILTDDVAVLHPGGECGCGIKSPYFEILGRAGIEDIKTCAANAAELLDGLKKG